MEKLELVDGQLNLLKNEREEAKFENVNHICRFRGPLIGQIFVTNYRFIFKADVSNTIFLQVPLNSLSKGIIRNIFFSV